MCESGASRVRAACESEQQPLLHDRALSASTCDTAATPSPRRWKSTGFLWADATPSECSETELAQLAEEICEGGSDEGQVVAAEQTSPCGASASGSSQWTPNAYAKEFIPTTTMDCVLVGVTAVCPHGRTPGFVGLGTVPVSEGADASQGYQQPPVSTRSGNVEDGRKSRRKPGHKRRPAPLASCKEDEGLLSQAPLAAAEGKGGGERPHSTGKHGVMPEATEEEWERRVATRLRAVELSRASKEYRLHLESIKDGLHAKSDVAEPKTPNPYDRTISKRSWKFLLHQWRGTLAQRYLDDGPVSVVSTEEWQSIGRAPTDDHEGPSTLGGDTDSDRESSA